MEHHTEQVGGGGHASRPFQGFLFFSFVETIPPLPHPQPISQIHTCLVVPGNYHMNTELGISVLLHSISSVCLPRI